MLLVPAAFIALCVLCAAGSGTLASSRGSQRYLHAETAASVELSNQLCGTEEYYCGGSVVYLEDAYAAATNAKRPCQQDKGQRN